MKRYNKLFEGEDNDPNKVAMNVAVAMNQLMAQNQEMAKEIEANQIAAQNADEEVVAENSDQATPSHLNQWQNAEAAEYVGKITAVFGEPDTLTTVSACWYNKIGTFVKVEVKDEAIAHEQPVEHYDFVYSTMKLIVPDKLIGQLVTISKSILVDALKGEVTARCGKLLKNAITLQLVGEIASGSLAVKDAKKEYPRRITEDEIPFWFEDRVGDANPDPEVEIEEIKESGRYKKKFTERRETVINLYYDSSETNDVTAFVDDLESSEKDVSGTDLVRYGTRSSMKSMIYVRNMSSSDLEDLLWYIKDQAPVELEIDYTDESGELVDYE